MENTLEELLGQKTPVLFKAAHVSIRQLAEKLRTAMKEGSKGGKETKGMQYVFGLPFVKTLKLWTQAVCRSEPLRPLIEPLVVVILSAIRAKENHLSYIPYVSVLLGLLNDLSEARAVFIPLGSACICTLTLCANKLTSKTLTAEGREPNISDVVRISDKNLKDRRVVIGLTQMLVREIARHCAVIARTPALPEISWPILASLKKLSKLNPSVKSELAGLITSLEKSIEEVKELRKGLPVSDQMFQFESESTSIGKYAKKLIETAMNGSKEFQRDVDLEEDSSDEDSGKSSSEDDTEQANRSKRSIKRERQKAKKRAALNQEPDDLVDRVISKASKIDLKAELVPFDLAALDEE
jgi:hypothetical protein